MGHSGHVHIQLCGAVLLSFGVGTAAQGVDGNQGQRIAALGAQMLCIVHSCFDGSHITAQINGSGACQLGAVRRVASLGHGAVLQLVDGLVHCEIAQSSSLCIPLSDCTTPCHHAVVLAQLVLGLNGSGQVGGDDAGCIKCNAGSDAVQTAGTDDALIVHGNGSQSHIVLSRAICVFGSRNALGHAGHDRKTGLQRTNLHNDISGLGLVHGLFHHNDGAHAACQQGCHQHTDDHENQFSLHS